MDGFSTVDGFVEISECLAEMIKYLANEPSVGLFYVQQHTRNSVPNLVNIKNNVEGKSRELALQREDLEDSITMVRSMKECGFPIVDEMLRDIKKSLVVVSTKEPKKGLLNNSYSQFQMGRTSSWGPAAWGRKSELSKQESERSPSYFTAVFKPAKQFDFNEVNQTEGEKLPSYLNPKLQVPVASTSSTVPSVEMDEPLLSRQTAKQRCGEESQIEDSTDDQVMALSENFDAFKADREAKLEEWLKATSNHIS